MSRDFNYRYFGNDSSVIAYVEYVPGRMDVSFKLYGGPSTQVYSYYFVPKQLFLKFAKAKSAGRFFAKKVRDKFPHRRQPESF